MRFFLFLILILLGVQTSHAKLKVITTTSDLAAIAAEVGADLIETESISKGTQDPHFIEAKPSYMVKVSRAHLVVSIGLGLESGWLLPILRGARNPKVRPGADGYLEVGPLLNPIEVIKGPVTRAQGDVHPEGNPHVTLDPVRAGHLAMILAERLGRLDPDQQKAYLERAKKMQERLSEKQKTWDQRLKSVKNRKIVTYHKTYNYFLERFSFQSAATLEPKPGIPPTARHILDVIKTIKENGIKIIMVENFFDSKVAERIKKEVPGVKVVSVPVAVGGMPGVNTIDDLYERLVSVLEDQPK